MNGNSNRIAVLFFLCYDGHMDEPGDLPALPEKEQIGMDKGVPMVDYGLKDRVVIITGAIIKRLKEIFCISVLKGVPSDISADNAVKLFSA